MASTENPVVLVSGAAGGIGYSTVSCLKRDGWRIAATSLENTDALEALLGPEDRFYPADLRDRPQAAAIVDRTSQDMGRLDGLVQSAGTSHVVAFDAQTDEDWDEVLSVNLSAAYRLLRAAAPVMAQSGNGGSIVLMSSIGWKSGGTNPAYGAAKAGINNLVYSGAQKYGPSGVRLNAIAPGVVDTGMIKNAFPGEAYVRIIRAASARTPLRRVAQPEDVAELAAFLLSDRASFITGSVIPVTGGFELVPPMGGIGHG